MNADNFSAIWEQVIPVQQGGLYRFQIEADDSAQVRINHTPVFNNLSYVGSATFDAELRRGQNFIEVLYSEHTGSARLRLTWERVQ